MDDTRLGVAEHSSASWDLERKLQQEQQEEAEEEQEEGFRYFRIVKTDDDASGGWYLHLSGIELYGLVRLNL